MPKFFELEGCFPRREDMPKAAVVYMAGQVKVDAALFADYRWSGSTIEYHRAQIRRCHGFHEPTVADEDKLTFWPCRLIDARPGGPSASRGVVGCPRG